MATKQRLGERHGNGVALATFGTEPDYSTLRYDYEQVVEEHRAVVRDAAVQIRANAERAQESIINIGQQLLDAKAVLPHGQFTDWIATEFELSDRMAQNMMNVAREYGSDESKAKRVSVFSASALYILAAPSTPPEVRAAIEEKAETTGKAPTRAEIQREIADAKPKREVKPSAPDQPKQLHVWELESLVRQWLDKQTDDADLILGDLRGSDVQASLDRWRPLYDYVWVRGKFDVDELKQAINNVAGQRQWLAEGEAAGIISVLTWEPTATQKFVDALDVAAPEQLREAISQVSSRGNAGRANRIEWKLRQLEHQATERPDPDEHAAMAEVVAEQAEEDAERAARDAQRGPGEAVPEVVEAHAPTVTITLKRTTAEKLHAATLVYALRQYLAAAEVQELGDALKEALYGA